MFAILLLSSQVLSNCILSPSLSLSLSFFCNGILLRTVLMKCNKFHFCP